MTVSESLTVFKISGYSDRMCCVNVNPLYLILQSMPALEKVSLENVKLTSELKGQSVTLSKSLKELSMSNGDVDLISLVSFLQVAPAVTKVSLQQCQVTGKLDGSPVILNKSLKEFVMSGGRVGVVSLVSLLQCMPTQAKFYFKECQLTGELDGNPMTLSGGSLILKESVMSLRQCQLTGELGGSSVMLSGSQKALVMFNSSVSALLHCTPSTVYA